MVTLLFFIFTHMFLREMDNVKSFFADFWFLNAFFNFSINKLDFPIMKWFVNVVCKWPTSFEVSSPQTNGVYERFHCLRDFTILLFQRPWLDSFGKSIRLAKTKNGKIMILSCYIDF